MPGFSGKMPSMEKPGETVEVNVDEYGFRKSKFSPSEIVTVVLGDSYTFGVYVDDEDTYVESLNKLSLANKTGEFFINAGFTGGLETDQHYAWLANKITDLRPSRVIYATFPPNDIMGIKKANWLELNKDGLPVKWESLKLEVNERGSIKEIANSTSSWLEMIHALPFLRESHVFVAIARVIDVFMVEKVTSGESYNFLFGLDHPGFSEQEAIYIDLIKGMLKLCAEMDVDFDVVLLPINFLVEPDKMHFFFNGMEKFDGLESTYYEDLSSRLEFLGVDVMNVETLMKESSDGPFFPANGEPHFNTNGHLFVARKIFEQ